LNLSFMCLQTFSKNLKLTRQPKMSQFLVLSGKPSSEHNDVIIYFIQLIL